MITAPAAVSRQEQRQARGPEGNERLTAATGTVLLVLFAVQGLTILSLTRLLTVHFFVGLLLTGPVALKIGSTGYRAYRYYTGAPAYRRQGTPALPLRLLGPMVVLLSTAVLATGITLALLGRSEPASQVLFLHKASFYLWLLAMGLHVLVHLWRLPGLLGSELRRDAVAGRGRRWGLLAAALCTGLLVALAGVHLVNGWR
ncbi:hypothetical protein DN069_02290 [Streptacidiphilus pinicola]|uniref:DUF4405 domain-containing protein n=1 Tax=Streptacidiphilus pinicola TaxID=2219663 RepID=A0A2X0JAT3_9ACTN|nr:hypothetical protein [Streptacidiphilus pinicola]RAG87366.1 hypothetical protein DN069_02290 [Streptacidiphilus pinicola]